MVGIRFRFPTGKYHGTRWGTFVNSGDVDWPPSPWRILRALLAVGHNRLGWAETPPAAKELIHSLSRSLPSYTLPRGAVEAHTRHYMPQFRGKKVKTTDAAGNPMHLFKESTRLLLDSFLHVGDGELGVFWDAELEPTVLTLLQQLVEAMTYLGRAESWVVARLDATGPGDGEIQCRPAEEEIPAATPIRLLSPVDPARYRTWREIALERALAEELAQKQADRRLKGKTGPKSLSRAQRRRVESRFPADLIACLGVDTNALQKEGWSLPPGSRSCTWWVPRIAREPVRWQRRDVARRGARPDTVVYQLQPHTRGARTLPPLRHALRLADRVHKTFAAYADGADDVELLLGTDGSRALKGHRHAHVLPVCLSSDQPPRDRLPSRSIDHIVVHIPGGINRQAERVLMRTHETWAKNLPPLRLSCNGVGRVPDFASQVPSLQTGQVWVSQTPFVPSRYLKKRGRNSLVGQVQAELEWRGQPPAEVIELEVVDLAYDSARSWRPAEDWPLLRGGRIDHRDESQWRLAPWWREYSTERDGRRPKQSVAVGLRLRFSEPTTGPLTLGFGSHYGLGRFVPEGP